MAKRIALVVLVVVLIVVGVGLWFATTQVDRLVAAGIEDWGRATTGTQVDVGSVAIEATRGHGRLARLTIGNPPGYKTPYALLIDNIDLSFDIASLTSVPVVREIVVDGAHLNAEQRGEAMNLTDIQRAMTKGDASAASVPADEQGKIIIDRFRLTHGRVTLTSELLGKPEDIELADVVVERIGRTSAGATYDEATEAVLTPILRAAKAAVEDRLKAAAGDAARDEIQKKASERLKDLLDRQ
jgi:hypothetical protein